MVSPIRSGRSVKTSVRSSRLCSDRATVCSLRVLMWAPRSWWKRRSHSKVWGSSDDCWEFMEFWGMGQATGAGGSRSLASSCWRLRSQRLTDRREVSTSRRKEVDPRTVVKDRGRRRSGGTTSLSVGQRWDTVCQISYLFYTVWLYSIAEPIDNQQTLGNKSAWLISQSYTLLKKRPINKKKINPAQGKILRQYFKALLSKHICPSGTSVVIKINKFKNVM